MLATPGEVGEGDETTATSDKGWGGGPLGFMGVTTARYPAPHPAAKASAPSTAPAITNRACAWPERRRLRLIQFRSCLLSLIVNQRPGQSGPGNPSANACAD